MTCILAIETATEACSAALLLEENSTRQPEQDPKKNLKQSPDTAPQQILFTRFRLAPREHTQLILPMLDEVLAEAQITLKDIDAIAFGQGPGAFTGLRIATGIAQGLSLSTDKPIIGVSSLMAMALCAQKQITKTESLQNISIIAAIDARMGEVYWAEYTVSDGELQRVGGEQLSTPTEMYKQAKALMPMNRLVLIGSGWDAYLIDFQNQNINSLSFDFIEEQFPDAEYISQLALSAFKKGEIQSIEEAQPVYLRNNVAEKSKKQ